MHRQADRRDPDARAVPQLRAGRRVAAPEVGRQLRRVRVGAERGARRAAAGQTAQGGIEVQVLDHGYSEQYEDERRQEGTTGSPPTATSSPSAVEDEAVPAALARRLAQLPAQAAEQGRRRVEPLLRPRHQRRSPPVGQRRGSLRRQRTRAAHRATSASSPKARRSSSANSAFANCRRRRPSAFATASASAKATADKTADRSGRRSADASDRGDA